ncbi:YfdX family protein [Hydrogenimonas sp.]
MKKGFLLSAMTAMMLAGSVSALMAEPGDFGVNGPDAWNQPLEKRVKHTDSFGDTYYTYNYVAPKQCVRKEVHKASQHFKKAPKEVVDALNATIAAVEAIDKNDLKTAKEQLKKATALFDKALKANPNLDLVPVDQAIVVKQFTGTVNDIKADIAMAQDLLKHYRTQQARDILMPLEDEIDITTHYLPMALYPKTTKRALELLEAGKTKAAMRELAAGFNLVVGDEVVIPIPLLTAQELVDAASKLGKERKKEALAHLKAAKEELHKALLLGYTTKHAKEYQALYDQIKKIAKTIEGGGATEKLFEHVKKDFESLLNKHRGEKRKLNDPDSVWQGTAKAHAAAAREETNDAIRFEEEMEANDF